MNSFEGLIDGSNLRTLTDYLRNRKSDFKTIYFVRTRDALAPTAELISTDSEGAKSAFVQKLKDGDICLSRLDLEQDADEVLRLSGAVLVNLNRVPADTCCKVLAVPPVFVAYAENLDLTPTRERRSMERSVRNPIPLNPLPPRARFRL